MFTFGILLASTFIVTIAVSTVMFGFEILKWDRQNDRQIFMAVAGSVFGICLALSAAGYFGGTFYAYSKEIWNYKGVNIRHELLWTEKRSEEYREKVGTERVKVGTDSKGKAIYENKDKYVTKTRYYTVKCGPYWTLTDEYGHSSSISEDEYETWKRTWGNERQTGMHRGTSSSGHVSIDGPIYECNWPGSFDTILPISEVNRYVNKVRASKYSVMKFKEASEELKAKYPRPADQGNFNPIINYGADVNVDGNDVLLAQRTNAFLGSNHQIHSMFLLFDATVGMDITNDFMSAWQGTNKNELVVFVGIDKETKKISWVKVESWMDNTTINGCIADYLLNKEYSSKLFSKMLMDVVPKYWHRKEFKDFDYLTIEVSPIIVFIVLILQVITGVGAFFVAKNKSDDEKGFKETFNSVRFTRNRY